MRIVFNIIYCRLCSLSPLAIGYRTDVAGKAVIRRGRAAAAGMAAALLLGMVHLRALLRALLQVVVLLGWGAAISSTAIAPAGRSAALLTSLAAWRC